jgi:hypothetical protein
LESLRRETKAEFTKVHEGVGQIREELSTVKATLPHLATTAELNKAVHHLESQMIRWFIFTGLGAGSPAFTIVKFVN